MMTTQVLLMNGLGIALASDSAVTAGGKVLNSSEKVFDLSLPHKIAVFSSGRAEFMGHPWEVLLSAWSERLVQPFESINDYRDSLYAFLRGLFQESNDLSVYEANYLRAAYFAEEGVKAKTGEILQRVVLPFFQVKLSESDYDIFLNDNLWTDDLRQKFSKLVTEKLVSDLQAEFDQACEYRSINYIAADDVTHAQTLIWVDKYWAQMGVQPVDDFPYWPEIPGFNEMVNRLLATSLLHADYEGESNIVIAGFGSTDLFPSASQVFFHGLFRGTLIKRFEDGLESSPEPRSAFFGQSDAIRSLTRGEDSVLTSTAIEASRRTLGDIAEQLSESTDEHAQRAREYVQLSLEQDAIAEEMRRVGNEKRFEPFTRAIAMSPILDLAEFAAQLVSVQAASAAMTQDNPSVGGFVDVATITHRRGFEWIRHKH